MTPDQEKSIVSNIEHLIERTSNLKVLATELLQHGVLTLAERADITGQNDIEDKAKLLYGIVIKKSPVCFKLLLSCLRYSGNPNIAELLEDALEKMKRGKMIYRRSSSTVDRYIKEDVGKTLIQGREMGIAEIFEEEPEFSQNWKVIFHLLSISEKRLKYIESFGNFAVKVTILLRDWTDQEKANGNLSNLYNIMEKRGLVDSAVRIKRMFEDYSAEAESGFLFEFRRTTCLSIDHQEYEIAKVLEDNPDFALHWEKLFLLLHFPMGYFQQFSNQATFVDKATRMLILWKDIGKGQRTYFDLARLLVQNGHRSTGGKILVLATM